MITINRKNKEGFTLIELMIVVAIIGVLAALAIYGVNAYLQHSKTAEARTNLASIWKGNETKYNQDTPISGGPTTTRIFCQASGTINTGTVPKSSKAAPDLTTGAGDDNTGWICLKFQLNGGVYYQYSYSVAACALSVGGCTAGTYTAVATGDLDGDGINSTFTLGGSVSNGTAGHGTVVVVNEDE